MNSKSDAKEVVIGVDLGTTNTCASVQLEKQPELFPLGGDKALLSSMVFIDYVEYRATLPPVSLEEEMRRFRTTDKPSSVVVGANAKDLPKRENIIFQSKLYIGRKLDEEALLKIIPRHPFKVVEGLNGYAAFEIDGRIHSPEFIAALILEKVKEAADARLGSSGIAPVKQAVIGVPAHFNQIRRKATKEAGMLAGFEKVHLITEPCAAGVHYKLNMGGAETRLLVVDIGGGTTDISDVHDDELLAELKVNALAGDNQLGGEDFTGVIEGMIAGKWMVANAKSLEELTPKSKSNIHKAAESAKLVLCSHPDTSFDCTINKVEESYTITADDFADQCSYLLERIMNLINEVKAENPNEWEEIECLLLMGGGAILPLLQTFLEKETKKPVNKALVASTSVMTGVAAGCAAFAVPMSHPDLRPEGMKERHLYEVIPYDLGIEDGDGNMRVLIPRHTAVPSKTYWDENFSFPQDHRRPSGYDDSFVIKVLEGNEKSARLNNKLGERTFTRKERHTQRENTSRAYIRPEEADRARRENAVKIGFRVDSSMQLQVEAEVIATKEKCELLVKTSEAVFSKKENPDNRHAGAVAPKRTLTDIDTMISQLKKGRK